MRPEADAFKVVRSQGFQENDGVVEADFAIDDITVKTAVVSGLANTRALLEQRSSAGMSIMYFVEVMACPGGCVGGGGQPIHDGEELLVF